MAVQQAQNEIPPIIREKFANILPKDDDAKKNVSKKEKFMADVAFERNMVVEEIEPEKPKKPAAVTQWFAKKMKSSELEFTDLATASNE